MYILGITNGETSSACLLNDQNLIAAASEERFSRKKLDNSFPNKSIDYVLLEGKINLSQVDKICYSWSKGFQDDLILTYFDRIVYETKNNPKGLNLFRDRINVELLRDKIKRQEFFDFLKNNKAEAKGIIYSHHEAHMYSALCFSGYENSLIITSDGRGDFESLSVSEYKKGKVKKIYSATSNDSLGTFYARVSKLLGFKPHRHEGKVTGLSANGDYRKCINLFQKMIKFKDGKIYGINGDYYKSFHDDYGKFKAWSNEAKKKLKNFKKIDIAAAAQKHLEDILLKMVNFYTKKTKQKNICLAGGVFANVLVNQKIRELKNINNIFIQPQMGDGGLALGAAAGYFFEKTKKMINFNNMYLGPKYKINIINKNKLEKKYKIKLSKEKNLSDFISKKISENKVVGLFQGRMEFGPRALCNRSILYHCFDKKINDNLNKRLNRSEFMPFAPVVTDKFARKAFKNWKKSHKSSKFMTMTYHCTNFMKKNCPAIVHVDGTARPQILYKKDNPLMYKILLSWHKKTNQIALLNTSFNHHEEPIVCTPEDAIKSFKRKNVDILILDNFVVTKQ